MKKIYLFLYISIISIFNVCAAEIDNFYVRKSVLSDGHWVKVGVNESGIYEISYAQLRTMGFSNPEKVGVFGRGGHMMSLDLLDENKNPLIDNDLAPIAVLHRDQKLYFYGEGPEKIELKSTIGQSFDLIFCNRGRNIYSNRGYYFLHEENNPVQMTLEDAVDNGHSILYGYDYVYHEKDLQLNNSYTGQLFWGEDFSNPSNRNQSWNYELTSKTSGSPVVLDFCFYCSSGTDGEATFGIEGAANNRTKALPAANYSFMTPISDGTVSLSDVSQKGKVFYNYSPVEDPDFAALDYWLITYQKTAPTLQNANGEKLSQERFTIPNLGIGEELEIPLSGGRTWMVMDISDSRAPRILNVAKDGDDGLLSFSAQKRNTNLIVFDPMRSQKMISSSESASDIRLNQNLHGLASRGAELIIITVPQLRQEAEEFAQYHRINDNLSVIVANVEEIYNEYSSGVPDPVAYRSFARNVYNAEKKLKNILLLGPLNNDTRGVINARDPFSTIIAFQNPDLYTERGAPNVNDFYGMMSEQITKKLEAMPIEVGVGLLPCNFPVEAQRMLNKIKSYETDPNHAYTLGDFLCIGGTGDNHIHDLQAKEIGQQINVSTNSHMVLSTLIIDAYGAKAARKKFIEYLDAGKALALYMGHGAPSFLGKDKNFFAIDHISSLHNQRLPFMMFGGCEITNTDRGQRGLGEALVLSTDYGLIGSLVATRDTWSGQNQEFMKIFANRMYHDGDNLDSPRLTEPLTIGEINARAKTQSISSNELSYQLISDPALIIPLANRRISYPKYTYTLSPGETLHLKGSVMTIDDQVDKQFRGEAVIKVLEPQQNILSADLESPGSDPLMVEYRDNIASMLALPVVNGVFEADIKLPASLLPYVGEKILILGTAYDSSRKLGAGTRVTVTLAAPDENLVQTEDKTAPTIDEFYYNAREQKLHVVCSDNEGLDLSQTPYSESFYMTIDGKAYTPGIYAPKLLDYNMPSYRKEITTVNLQNGSHLARVVVKDAAGNKTTRELQFTISSNNADFSLVAENAVSHKECVFHITGQPRNPKLIIIDSAGANVFATEMNGTSYVWDRCGFNAEPLKPGLYRAYILEQGDFSDKTHSEPIEIPVI